MSKYDFVCIYTKKGNLLEYFYAKQAMSDNPVTMENMRKYYEQEREIQLVLKVRFERVAPCNLRVFCKIQCPVNPIPAKGEFEVHSVGSVERFLLKNGWVFKQKIYSNMFE